VLHYIQLERLARENTLAHRAHLKVMDKIKCGYDSGSFYSIGPWRKPSEMEALKTLKADNMMAEIFRTASKPRSDRSQLVLGEKL
jgi:hypothetical protein